MGLVNSANNGNATNHLFAVEFDTILNSEFKDISGALSARGGGQAELQKGAGKKACSCGSSQRQGQPGGGRAA
uniref:Legume lectin domain-containing protein n=1 Tax=Oryza glumipatula TaxID=40148 RepID=A0A0D9ZYI6_9ORYZ